MNKLSQRTDVHFVSHPDLHISTFTQQTSQTPKSTGLVEGRTSQESPIYIPIYTHISWDNLQDPLIFHGENHGFP